MMEWFTIVGYYADTKQGFVDWQHAETARDATQASRASGGRATLRIVAVFKGKLTEEVGLSDVYYELSAPRPASS